MLVTDVLDMMLDIMTEKGADLVGLAEECTINIDGEISSRDNGPAAHKYVFMTDESQNDVVMKLKNMFPEVDTDLIQDFLDTNKQNVERTIDELLLVYPSSGLEENLAALKPSALTERSAKKIPPCPECPVCYEQFLPPKRVYQCTNGHLICESCKENPRLKTCPTCKNVFMGRATAMEKLLADIY